MPSNAYLIIDDTETRCIVIDPGTKYQKDIIDFINKNNLELDYIFLTHEHFDHCWGVNSLLEFFPTAKVVATKLCAEWISTPMNYFNKLYFDSDEFYAVKKVDLCLEDIGWEINWDSVCIRFIDAKGHSNKGVCLNIGNALFTGDTLLLNTKPFLKKKYGASFDELKRTVINMFNTFKDNTIVYPGHGMHFYLKEARPFYIELFGDF